MGLLAEWGFLMSDVEEREGILRQGDGRRFSRSMTVFGTISGISRSLLHRQRQRQKGNLLHRILLE